MTVRRRFHSSPINVGRGSGTVDTFIHDLHDDALHYSVNHPYSRRKHTWLSGGGFWTTHESMNVQTASLPTITFPWRGTHIWSGSVAPVHGYLLSVPKPKVFSDPETAMDNLSNAYGAKAFRRARPGSPSAGILNFTAELRDLPQIPLRALYRLKRFRSLGGEYLNIQFGWAPFLQDLKKMHRTYMELDRQLAQLVRNNGRGIRRRGNLGETTTTTSTTTYSGNLMGNAFYNAPAAIPPYNLGRHTAVHQTITTEKIWYSSRFHYYIPDIGSSQWTRRATRALYGLNPTPAVLWDALPWSWLIDYFSNIGDIVHNMSANAVDNLVADYFYVMKHTRVEERRMSTGQWPAFSGSSSFSASPAGSLSLTSTKISESKLRSSATPYGFNVDFGSLSAHQIGIISALGISRSRF